MADSSGESLCKDHNQPDHHELSGLISLKDFKEMAIRVHADMYKEGLEGSNNSDIQNKMGVPDDVLKYCVESCNPKTLTEDSEDGALHKQKRTRLPKDTGLESIDGIKNLPEGLGLVPFPGLAQSVLNVPPDHLVQCPEILLTVLTFHPIVRKPHVEYLVLGCQLLTELKDMLFCPRDYAITTDCSDNLEMLDQIDMKNVLNPSKSGYFFINNTFYNDTREVDAEDYSSVVIKWVESNPERYSRSSRLDHFTKADMRTTKFEQLSLRLGYPYVYCHHGNCEHGIVFTDLRLFSPSDVQDKRSYPFFTRHCKILRRRCCVCEEFTARVVTMNDELATESPAFFCKPCFTLLHYDLDGKKMAKFQAYPYLDELTTLLNANAQKLNMDY